jgi:methionyl aminopeptidase
MVHLKSAEDIQRLREGGRILAQVLQELKGRAKVGVTPIELDGLARVLVADAGCRPAFLNYAPVGMPPFPAALCVSVNEAVVHGLPNSQPLREGDLVGLDLGLIYRDKYYLDSALTVGVGEISGRAKELIAATEEALMRGIDRARIGGRIGDIGAAIQAHVEGCGFRVVRQLVGHGVGFAVHEPPQVPNFGRAGRGERIREGLVIAIEPMVVEREPAVETAKDGWTVITCDGGQAAHFEHTVAVTAEGPLVLTAAV